LGPTGLLQYGAGQSTGLHYCAATACSERGSMTHHRSSSMRSRDISTTRPTLAQHRITYKLCALIYLVHTGSSPSYLSVLVTATANMPFRSDLELPTPIATKYEPKRCFSHAGPIAWNELPTELQDLTVHSAFRRQLNTFLFERVFTTQ